MNYSSALFDFNYFFPIIPLLLSYEENAGKSKFVFMYLSPLASYILPASVFSVLAMTNALSKSEISIIFIMQKQKCSRIPTISKFKPYQWVHLYLCTMHI